MATSNRAAVISKVHKVLKKHYKPSVPADERTLLENLLFAACLQNAPFEKATEAFGRVQSAFFDWNEVRVTTVSELADVVRELPDPTMTASHIKTTLQSIFESTYSFDLEHLKKQNIGQTVKQLQGYSGVSNFAVAYVTQHSLGGHAIPLDQSTLKIMYIVGAINETELEKNVVPGLERAVPKKKGIEFASLLHQLGADLCASPYSPELRAILLEIAPDAQPRLPKRAKRKAAKPPSAEQTEAPPKTPPSKPGGKKITPKRSSSAKKKTGPSKKTESKPTTKGPVKKKSPTKQLAKRKPR
jgi:endonuclease-3